MIRNSLLCFLFLGVTAYVNAQNYVGTDFRFAFMKNLNPTFNTPPKFDVSVQALEDVSATVEFGLPSDAFYQTETITIAQGDVGVVSFDQDQFLNQETLNIAETRTFRVTTTGAARVNAFHNRLYFAEASAILPVGGLGDDYMVLAYEGSNGAYPSLFSIVGTVDGTEVEVTPTSATLLGGAGDTYTVTLDAGEAITISSSGDLTGSRVTSDGAPVAVFGGQQQGFVGPTGCGADSHFWEQIAPLSDWGTAFPVVPTGGNGGDLYRILAATDGTEVYSGCDLLTTLAAGQFYDEFYEDPFLLTASEPVSVAAFMRGKDCSGNDTGDPNMRIVLPIERANTDVRVRAEYPLEPGVGPFDGPPLNVVHLVMPTDETGDLALNGNPVTNWQPFDSQPLLSYSEVVVPDIDNVLTLESPSPFWADLVSLKGYDAFTFSLGSNAAMIVPPLDLTVVNLGEDQSICPGESIILDPGITGGGTWQDGSVQETFTVVEPGIYSISVDAACGDGVDEVEITAGFVPTVELPEDIIACSNEEQVLEVTEETGVTYEWSTGEDGTVIVVTGFGTFSVTGISTDGCEASASVSVVDGATATVEVESPDAICEEAEAVLVAVSDEPGTFTWEDGTEGTELTISEPGAYTVLFVPEEGCEKEETVNVGQLDLPFVFANDTVICQGDVLQLRGQSPNGEVFWPQLSESSILEVDTEGIYEVAAENECGTSFFTVNIGTKDCSCPAYVPNAFTPNGDGLNDLLVPEILCKPDFYELVIFNRWGVEVFSTTDFNVNWNGDSKSNDEFFSSDGVYHYILKYDNPLRPLDDPKELAGSVMLVR